MPERHVPSGAAQTRVVSVARIRPGSRNSVRPFKGIICGDISEFESHRPSQAVPVSDALTNDTFRTRLQQCAGVAALATTLSRCPCCAVRNRHRNLCRASLWRSRVLQRSSSPGSDTPPRGPIRHKARDCPNRVMPPPGDRWCVSNPMRPAFPVLVLAGFRTQQTERPATLIVRGGPSGQERLRR